jgi:hypothetical protein
MVAHHQMEGKTSFVRVAAKRLAKNPKATLPPDSQDH